MKSFLAAFVGLLLMTSNAHAIALTFKLDIFSSGADIYACNAGLKHKGYNSRVCYERDQPETSCNPNLCEEGQACNCVCTGSITGEGDGEYRLDFLKASFSDWADHGEIGANSSTVVREAGINSFNKVFDNNEAFGKELKSLTFNLGSERYGAVYFLDVCFRATQIRYDYNGSTINWAMERQVTITDLANNGYNYEELAGLQVKAAVQCNIKGGGDYSLADSGWQNFNGNDLINWSKKNISKDLKNCKVRYYFRESKRQGLQSLRKWNLQEARVCTYTSFNEPSL